MQIKIFRVSADQPEEEERELNQFLRAHRILTVERELVSRHSEAYWSFVVEYLPSSTLPEKESNTRGKEDYREILDARDFALYCRLKEVRKALSEEVSVPVYGIFTNRQLADMVQNNCSTLSELENIHGVGKKRVQQYGPAFLEAIQKFADEGESTADRIDGEPEGRFPESSQG